MRIKMEELIVIVSQLLVFYIFPIMSVPNEYMGIIVLILLATFLLSLAIGGMSSSRFKYYYPVIISILFIPTVYIYYSEFELIHSLWCLGTSFIGIIIGKFIMKK